MSTELSQALQRPGASITELMDAPDSRWIQTVSGRAFWPLNPRPEDICIEDIAHALAMKCRYTGHTRHFYSVAQHSVIASRHVPSEHALWALLHDAAEAYLPDIARPVKKHIAGFDRIELRVMEAVITRFGLSPCMPACVGLVDLRLLATEARDLMAKPPYRWMATYGIEPLPQQIFPLYPMEARFRFMQRFKEITEGGDGA